LQTSPNGRLRFLSLSLIEQDLCLERQHACGRDSKVLCTSQILFGEPEF
jgi:hypothetical protein